MTAVEGGGLEILSDTEEASLGGLLMRVERREVVRDPQGARKDRNEGRSWSWGKQSWQATEREWQEGFSSFFYSIYL